MASKLKPYTPTEKDLAFFRTLIAGLKEGGMWIIPRTGQTYRVSQSSGTFTLVHTTWDANPEVMMCHHHNHYILKKLGWKCLPEVDWENL